MKKIDKNFIYILLLIGITIISRIYLFKDFFHEWDPINFALAIDDFNPHADQPHPPFYPIPVFLSKIIFFFIRDHLKSLQILSLLFSLLAVILFYLLMNELTKKETYSFITTLIFSFSPIFYFYGTVEDIYSSEAFITLLFGLFTFLSIKNEKYLFALSFFYGLISGIRFNDLLFLFPLYIFILFKLKIKFKNLIKNFFIFSITTLSITLFIILSYGDYRLYSIHSKTLFTWVIGSSYFLDKSYWYKETYKSFLLFLRETIIPLIILTFLFLKLKDKKNFLFFILWAIPSFLFYFFIHTPKVGYYLTIIPVIYLFFFYEYYQLNFHFKKFISLILITIFMINSSFLFINLRKDLNKQITIEKDLLERINKSIENKNCAIFVLDETADFFTHLHWYVEAKKIFFISSYGNYISEWNVKNGFIEMEYRKPLKIKEENIINFGEDIEKLIFITDKPRDLIDLLELENTKIEESIGTLTGEGFTIISYEIEDNFDFLFVRGFILKRK